MSKRNILKRMAAAVSAAATLVMSQAQLIAQIPQAVAEEENGKSILLIQDNLPWDSDVNTKVLDSIGVDYTKVTTSQFLDVELEKYAVVIFANDQSFKTYGNYVDFKEYMELYASLGGVIVFGACDGGWANGTLTDKLPGNVEKFRDYSNYNYVEDMNHPIITAALSDGNGAAVEGKNSSMWYNNYCSHTSFVEDTLPAGANVLVRSTNTDAPTLVEYPLGSGRVIASGLTHEHAYNRRDNYAKRIVDDLFLYALKVSDFDGREVTQLKDYRLMYNQPYVVVADAVTKAPVVDASVIVDGEEFNTNEYGVVPLDGKIGKKKVTVRADGYRTSCLEYTLRKRKAQAFYLKADDSGGRPYPLMAVETSKDRNLFTQKIYFDENGSDWCSIKVDAEWNGHTPGRYEIFQYGSEATKATSSTGSFYFNPGKRFKPEKNVYLRLVSADGTVSVIEQLQIVVKAKPGVDHLSEYSDTFKVTPDQSGTMDDEDAALVMPDDFEINIPAFPVSMEGEENDDGTYSLKIIIGSEDIKDKDFDTIGGHLKDIFTGGLVDKGFDDAEELLDQIDAIAERAANNKFHTATGRLGDGKPEIGVEVAGYYEIVFDARDGVVSQGGGIAINITGEGSYTQGFFLGPVPIYLNLSGEAGLESVMSVLVNTGGGGEYTGEATISAGISISAGVGLNGIISVGVGGGLDFEIGIAPEIESSATLSAFVEAYLLFIIDLKWTFAQHTFQFWPKENGNRQAGENEFGDEFEVIDLDYLNYISGWNGSVGGGVNVLQSSVLPSTMPMIAQAGGNKVMVWQATDANAQIFDSTKLMASYYENGVWSEPQLVTDAEGADLVAKLYTEGDDIYLVWQKQNGLAVGENDTELANYAINSTDIFAACWNGTEFADIQCVADDDTCDILPVIAADGDKLTAVWVKVTGNPLSFTDCGYTILASDFVDGAWGEPYEIGSTEEYVSSIEADYVNGLLCTAYTSVNLYDAASAKLYVIYDGAICDVSGEEGTPLGAAFRNGILYYANGGKLYSFNPETFAVEEAAGNLTSLASSFILADDASSLIMTDGKKFSFSVNENGSWSKPIELIGIDGYTVSNYSAVYNDGVYSIVLNGRDANGSASILYVEAQTQESIEIGYVDVITDPETREQILIFNVINNQSHVIDALTVDVTSADGTVISTVEYPAIAPGEKGVFTYTLPENINGQAVEYTVTVADGENTASGVVTANKPDLAVEVETYYVNGDVVFAVQVSNLSNTPVEAAIRINEDSKDGIALDMKNAGVITPDEDYLIFEHVDLNEVAFNENGVKYYYITVDALGEEASYANNTVVAVVYKEAEQPEPNADDEFNEFDATDPDSIVDDPDGENNSENETPEVTTTVATTTAQATTTAAATAPTNSPKTGDAGVNTLAVTGVVFSFACLALCRTLKRKQNRNI